MNDLVRSDTTSPEIRYFEHTDPPDVSSIYRAAAKEAVTRECSYDQVPNEDIVLEPSEDETIFVCEGGEKVIGFAQALITRPGESAYAQT